MSDGAIRIVDINGDEFAECDYGLVMDNSENTQLFMEKFEGYAQALIQNQMISTSTLIKLWNGSSIADITRSVEDDERKREEQIAEQQEAQQEQFQQEIEQKLHLETEDRRIREDNNIRDNETRVLIESMRQYANQEAADFEKEDFDPQKKAELEEKIRQFNEKIALDKQKLADKNSQESKLNSLRKEALDIQRKKATS